MSTLAPVHARPDPARIAPRGGRAAPAEGEGTGFEEVLASLSPAAAPAVAAPQDPSATGPVPTAAPTVPLPALLAQPPAALPEATAEPEAGPAPVVQGAPPTAPAPAAEASAHAAPVAAPAERAVPAPAPDTTTASRAEVPKTAAPAGPVEPPQTRPADTGARIPRALAEAVVTGPAPVPEAAAPPDAPVAATPSPTPAPLVLPVVTGVEAAAPPPLQPVSESPAAAPAPPPTAAPAPTPADQVVTGITPLVDGPDGTYTMSLQLYPEELGSVQVEVALRGGEITLALHAPDEGAREVLRSALPELRSQLESTGLTATGVTVGDGRDRERQAHERAASGTRSGDGADETPADEPTGSTSASDSALDVRI